MSPTQIIDLVRPYRGRLLLVAALTIATSALSLIVPWLAASAIGKLVAGSRFDLAASAATIVAVLVTLALAGFAANVTAMGVALEIRSTLRRLVHHRLQHLPMAFHDQHSKGDLMALTTYEAPRLGNFISLTLASLPAQLLTIVGAAILMYRIDPRLGLVIPLLIPIFYLALKVVGRMLRGLAEAIRAAEADVVAHDEESLQMLLVNKAFARTGIEEAHHRALLDRELALSLRENRVAQMISPIAGLVAASAVVVVIAAAGSSVRDGSMNPTELFALMFYAALLTRPVAALAHIYGQINTARGALSRLGRLLDVPLEPGGSGSGGAFDGRGDIVFQDVRFGYGGGRKGVFAGLDLTLPAGRVIVLVGENGAGKTTLVHLLLRLYELDGGRITIGGRDITALDLESLRRAIGFVPQRVMIADGSIADAIRFGRDDASPADIELAARQALAHDFITRLPDGYATRVGEQGVLLSGGERQRIALARAILRDPPILILDEAMAMVDDASERLFLDHADEAFAGRTVIHITHRPEAIARADQVVRLERGGTVVQQPRRVRSA
jgi:ATP-binding cassette subfamily B protein